MANGRSTVERPLVAATVHAMDRQSPEAFDHNELHPSTNLTLQQQTQMDQYLRCATASARIGLTTASLKTASASRSTHVARTGLARAMSFATSHSAIHVSSAHMQFGNPYSQAALPRTFERGFREAQKSALQSTQALAGSISINRIHMRYGDVYELSGACKLKIT